MAEQEIPLIDRARLCVETCLDVRAGESVFVLTDEEHEAFAGALVEVAEARGGTAQIAMLADRRIYEKEPPPEVAAQMRESDVIIINLPPEYGCQLWHTPERQAASQAGARVGLVFPPATWQITPEEIAETRVLTENLSRALDEADEVRLTTPGGTDLTMSLRGRRGYACYSILHNPGDTATIPDWGDAEASPVEGTAEGTVVMDGSMTFIGKITEPIVLTVRGGVVTEVQGGEEAERLRAILDEADEGGRNIAEFGIGTVPRGEITGSKDDKLLGTVHIALGHNVTLGGTVDSNIHLDGLMLRPTIVLDGKTVMEDGVPIPALYEETTNGAYA